MFCGVEFAVLRGTGDTLCSDGVTPCDFVADAGDILRGVEHIFCFCDVGDLPSGFGNTVSCCKRFMSVCVHVKQKQPHTRHIIIHVHES